MVEDERRRARACTFRNFSVRATKSVSQFSSTSAAVPPSTVVADEAFGGDAAGLLGGGGEALLAEDLLGLVDVAVRLFERALAVEHPGAGLVAEHLDHHCGNRHGDPLYVKKAGGRRVVLPPARHRVDRDQAWTGTAGPLGLGRARLGHLEVRGHRLVLAWTTLPTKRSSCACRPSSTASAILPVKSLIARIASSLPGITKRDVVRVAVRVDDRDDRDAELLGLLDRDRFLLGVDHEQDVRELFHVLDADEVLRELRLLAVELDALLLREDRVRALDEHRLDLLEARDRLPDRHEVRERAAEPAVVHVEHAAAVRLLVDGVLRLALRADEEDVLALRGDVRDEGRGLAEALQRLLEVDDVDAVALPEDVLLHLRVPALGLVAEVDARLEQLLHRDLAHLSPITSSRTGTGRGRRAGRTSCAPSCASRA